MYPDKIFGLFTLYGLLIGLGILAAFMVIWKLAKIGKVEDKFVDFTSIALVVAVAVGFFFAMVFQSLYEWIELRQTLPDARFTLNTGMTFLGGLIGGVACYIPIYFIFRKKFQGRFIDIITILPIALTLAHGFGRFGCFTAGCCYGLEATGPLAFLGITFPGMSAPVWPTQLFEAVFLLIMAIIMLILYLKKRFQHNMSLYLVTYGIFRFLIEYIRGDDRGVLIPGVNVSPSQWISIFMIVLGIILAIFMAPMFKKRREYLLTHPIVEPTVGKGKKECECPPVVLFESNTDSSSDAEEPAYKVVENPSIAPEVCPLASVDTAEDGFKLDEKTEADRVIENHIIAEEAPVIEEAKPEELAEEVFEELDKDFVEESPVTVEPIETVIIKEEEIDAPIVATIEDKEVVTVEEVAEIEKEEPTPALIMEEEKVATVIAEPKKSAEVKATTPAKTTATKPASKTSPVKATTSTTKTTKVETTVTKPTSTKSTAVEKKPTTKVEPTATKSTTVEKKPVTKTTSNTKATTVETTVAKPATKSATKVEANVAKPATKTATKVEPAATKTTTVDKKPVAKTPAPTAKTTKVEPTATKSTTVEKKASAAAPATSATKAAPAKKKANPHAPKKG